MLINLAKAIGRLVVSYKEVQNLAGYTTLINEMDEVLGDLSKGQYKRVMVTQGDSGEQQTGMQLMSVSGNARIVKSD